MKEKTIKIVPQKNEKASPNQTLRQKSHQRNKYLGCLPCKIFWIILEIDLGRTHANGPRDMRVNDDAQDLIFER